jgi:colanic acid biosynthesis protein WcaH
VIQTDLYKSIIRLLPIVCVDIVVKNTDGKFLLVKRKNNPLKGQWWVVGGRIEHMEKAQDAAKRKLKEEADLEVKDLLFEGCYEDNFDNNAFDDVPYHTISLIFSCIKDDSIDIKLDKQSSDWVWSEKLPDRFNYNRV